MGLRDPSPHADLVIYGDSQADSIGSIAGYTLHELLLRAFPSNLRSARSAGIGGTQAAGSPPDDADSRFYYHNTGKHVAPYLFGMNGICIGCTLPNDMVSGRNNDGLVAYTDDEMMTHLKTIMVRAKNHRIRLVYVTTILPNFDAVLDGTVPANTSFEVMRSRLNPRIRTEMPPLGIGVLDWALDSILDTPTIDTIISHPVYGQSGPNQNYFAGNHLGTTGCLRAINNIWAPRIAADTGWARTVVT